MFMFNVVVIDTVKHFNNSCWSLLAALPLEHMVVVSFLRKRRAAHVPMKRKERRNKRSMPTKTLGERPTTHAPNLQMGTETPIAMSNASCHRP